MIGSIVILVLIGAAVIDIFLMAIYCRIMEKLDNKRKVKRDRHAESVDDNYGNTVSVNKTSVIKKTTLFIMDHFLYGLMRYSVLLTGKIPSGHIRNWIYRFIFNMKITKKTVIYGGCEIRSPWNFHADNCVISNNCILDCRNGITIGENVVFGGGVHVWTEQHDINSPTFQVTSRNRGPVVIDDRAWICSDTTILPNIHIGEGAVLASRACATKNLDSFSVYAGIPAKKISERNHDLVYELTGKAHWHFY